MGAVVHHNSRLGLYNSEGAILDGAELPDYIKHPDQARHNWNTGVSAEEVHGRRRYEIQAANLKRKPQKNAAYAIEASFSASPEWFEGKEIGQKDRMFDGFLNWAKERFGAQNILQAAVHYDETTPHMHLLMVPIVQTEKGAKYSSSEFLAGREGLRQIQTDLAAYMKPFGLSRGVEGSKARHTDQHEWMAERERALAKKEAALAQQTKDLESLRKTLLTANQDRIAAVRIQKEVEILLGKESPVYGQWIRKTAETTATIPAEKRDEFIRRMQAVIVELQPKKAINRSQDKTTDRGR